MYSSRLPCENDKKCALSPDAHSEYRDTCLPLAGDLYTPFSINAYELSWNYCFGFVLVYLSNVFFIFLNEFCHKFFGMLFFQIDVLIHLLENMNKDYLQRLLLILNRVFDIFWPFLIRFRETHTNSEELVWNSLTNSITFLFLKKLRYIWRNFLLLKWDVWISQHWT